MDAEDLFLLVFGIWKCWKSITCIQRTDILLLHQNHCKNIIVTSQWFWKPFNHSVSTKPSASLCSMDAENRFLVFDIWKCWKSVTGIRRKDDTLTTPKPLQPHHLRYRAVVLWRPINHNVSFKPSVYNYYLWMLKIGFWSLAYENAEKQ